MKALVTGAAGFIGSHLTAALLDRGADVTGIDCFTDYYPRAIKEANLGVNARRQGFHFVEGALQSTDLAALLEGKTHVFHLAAQAGVRKSWGSDFRIYTDNNVDATQRLLEACVGRPLHRFVYASSSSVYGDNVSIPMREDALPQPVSPYGVTKLAAEQLCYLYHANHRVPTTSVRYFTVYGPRQRPDMAFHRFIRAALRGDAITLYGDGEQTRDFTFVTDAVAATIAAGDQGELGLRLQRRRRLARLGQPALRDHRPHPRPAAPHPAGARAEGRHARYLRRHDQGPGRPRIFAQSSLEQGLEAEYHWLANTPALVR